LWFEFFKIHFLFLAKVTTPFFLLYKFVKNFILKNLFLQYKPFLVFLGKFLLTYILLTFLYQIYLNQYDSTKFEVDFFTKKVANESNIILKWIDFDSYTTLDTKEPSINIYFHHKCVSRIIEGCNAISILILFLSFVIAFTGKLKQTILFVLFGSILIHLLNICRIALLSVALFYFPKYEHILHGVIFPLIIYGVVFILWVIWVNKFSVYAKKN